MAPSSPDDEFDPYREAPTLLHANQTSSSTLSPNRPTYDKSAPTPEGAAQFAPAPTDPDPLWTIVLTGGLIVLAVLLVLGGLMIQIFRMHVYHIDRAIYTTAPLGPTLAIIHVTSLVVGLSVPIVLGLSAYSLAGRWLAASRVDGNDRPTPYQLGVMMKTLNGANVSALWHSSNYIAGRTAAPGGKNIRSPPMLRKIVFMLLFFLLLGYGATLVETWLGSVSLAVPYPVTDNSTGVQLLLFGREVNHTLCEETKDASNNQPYQCGLVHGSSGNPQAEGLRILTMNGLSKTTVIAFTDDSTAIMVPPTTNLSALDQLGLELGWVATTLGVKSTCTSVTAQCIDPENLGPNAGLVTNCSASVNFNTTALQSDTCNPYQATMYGGPLGPDGVPYACLKNSNSTQFRFGIEVNSYAYSADYSTSGETFVGDTGFFLHGNRGGYNLLTCNVSVLNVKYHYFNGTYTVLSSTTGELEQAQRVSDGSWAALQEVPPEDRRRRDLSLVSLSATVYATQPIVVLSTDFTTTYIGSRIPLAPFSVLIVLILIYCISVVFVTAEAAIHVRRSPTDTLLARSRLLDPATAIGTAYGREETKGAVVVQELFGDETAEDRLNIAVDAPADGFPIVRRSGTLG
ncbi:hypothetical protein C8F01DRAFT_1255705 [Mycena amicta]|nr:hypothetical protein C8F01DRAFT_1255705 [Mycena amicta]